MDHRPFGYVPLLPVVAEDSKGKTKRCQGQLLWTVTLSHGVRPKCGKWSRKTPSVLCFTGIYPSASAEMSSVLCFPPCCEIEVYFEE